MELNVFRSLLTTLNWLIIALLALNFFPSDVIDLKMRGLFVVGLFGLWRYGWITIHLARSIIYRHFVFPKLRLQANKVENKYPKRLYIAIMSYYENFELTERMLNSLIKECLTICNQTQIIVLIDVGSDDEIEFMTNIIKVHRLDDSISFKFLKQNQGKRVAQGFTLRTVSRLFLDPYSWHNDTKNDIIIMMDGDSILTKGTFEKILPIFRIREDIGAVTTHDEIISKNPGSLYHRWFEIKFAQRNQMFCSHSLSNKVLTLTGRFSIMRAHIATKADFIGMLETDYLDHWLYGRFRFLMGDDKTTWFYMMQQGHNMIYIPDVTIYSMESRSLDNKEFYKVSTALMRRWYGNTLRINQRAMDLGYKKTGFFIWLCLLDQRVGCWTPLIGPASILFLSYHFSLGYLYFYALWTLFIRIIVIWHYVANGFTFYFIHMPILLFSQWVGSFIKIYKYNTLDIQTWTKNNIRNKRQQNESITTFRKLRRAIQLTSLTVGYAIIVFVPFLTTGFIKMPEALLLAAETDYKQQTEKIYNVNITIRPDQQHQNISEKINNLIKSYTDKEKVRIYIPAGEYVLEEPIIIDRPNISIVGDGIDKTVLISTYKSKNDGLIKVWGTQGKRVITLNPFIKQSLMQNTLYKKGYLWVGVPNDDEYLRSINSVNWNEQYPWIRQEIVNLLPGKGNVDKLEFPLAFNYPDKVYLSSPKMVTGANLSGFTIRYDIPGHDITKTQSKYENLYPKNMVDSIWFKWAADSTISNVKIINAGRNPLVFENSYNLKAKNVFIDGAWNKGDGGSGYIRLSRAYYCQLEQIFAQNIRHLTIQWSSHDNVVKNSWIYADINFHGGQTSNNSIIKTDINPPPYHKWKRITRISDQGAHWAPPDGKGNNVDGVDVKLIK